MLSPLTKVVPHVLSSSLRLDQFATSVNRVGLFRGPTILYKLYANASINSILEYYFNRGR